MRCKSWKLNSGTDRSFVSLEFRPLIDIHFRKLGEAYAIEFANGKKVETRDIICGCSIDIIGELFSIALIPIKLGSFDVVVGMDYLSRNRAEIYCFEKIVRIPIQGNRTIIIQGEKPERDLRIVSCTKIHKYMKEVFCFLGSGGREET